ncbi:hypothetical protein C2S51_016030 [Perilla frutescens var. frutescens]|nr:hypothetical protein C2S51_016030 [Perilla frutescens var. frutescens]
MADSSKKTLDVVHMMPRIMDHKLTVSNYLDWRNTIRNSVKSGVIGMVSHCHTIKALLAYLEFLYSGKESLSRMYTVCQAFYKPDKGDQSLTDYFMAFTNTYEELNMFLPFSSDTKVQQARHEKMALAYEFFGSFAL